LSQTLGTDHGSYMQDLNLTSKKTPCLLIMKTLHWMFCRETTDI